MFLGEEGTWYGGGLCLRIYFQENLILEKFCRMQMFRWILKSLSGSATESEFQNTIFSNRVLAFHNVKIKKNHCENLNKKITETVEILKKDHCENVPALQRNPFQNTIFSNKVKLQ